jgi:hypothetical protein
MIQKALTMIHPGARIMVQEILRQG